MAEFLRVRDRKTGHEYTIRAYLFDHLAHEIVDKPALDRHGLPAPVRYRVGLGDSPAPSAVESRSTPGRFSSDFPVSVTPVLVPEQEPDSLGHFEMFKEES